MDTSQGKALLSVGVDAILAHQPQPLNKTKVGWLIVLNASVFAACSQTGLCIIDDE